MRKIVASRLEEGRLRSGPYGSDSSYGLTGAFKVHGPCGAELAIIASNAEDPEVDGFEHVSVSTARRCPNWEEMSFVKDLFWGEEETVIQFHVPKKDHINCHPYTLHLWRDTRKGHRLPPSILVGPSS